MGNAGCLPGGVSLGLGVYRLVYFSGETARFTIDELNALAVEAQRKNTALEVTGLLLYRHGNFLQVLEGDEAVVKDLFNKISEDPRHRRVIAVLQEPIAARDFSSWSMAFYDLNDESAIPAGADTSVFTERHTEKPKSESVRRLIGIFAKATTIG